MPHTLAVRITQLQRTCLLTRSTTRRSEETYVMRHRWFLLMLLCVQSHINNNAPKKLRHHNANADKASADDCTRCIYLHANIFVLCLPYLNVLLCVCVIADESST